MGGIFFRDNNQGGCSFPGTRAADHFLCNHCQGRWSSFGELETKKTSCCIASSSSLHSRAFPISAFSRTFLERKLKREAATTAETTNLVTHPDYVKTLRNEINKRKEAETIEGCKKSFNTSCLCSNTLK